MVVHPARGTAMDIETSQSSTALHPVIPICNKKCIFVGRVLTRHVGLKPDLRKKINVVSIANFNKGSFTGMKEVFLS